jgi:hypothetical protein
MDKKTFSGVDAATWEKLKALGTSQHGTVFDPADAESGTATTRTPVGTLVLGFAFDAANNSLTYTIVEKPLLVASNLIWSGIEDSIGKCRQG